VAREFGFHCRQFSQAGSGTDASSFLKGNRGCCRAIIVTMGWRWAINPQRGEKIKEHMELCPHFLIRNSQSRTGTSCSVTNQIPVGEPQGDFVRTQAVSPNMWSVGELRSGRWPQGATLWHILRKRSVYDLDWGPFSLWFSCLYSDPQVYLLEIILI